MAPAIRIPEINFDRLISRGLSRVISKEMDLAGMKLSVNTIIEYTLVPAFALFIIAAFLLYSVGFGALDSWAVGLLLGGLVMAFMYLYVEYLIDKRKTELEDMLPDFLQIAAANLRSGISLERALLLAARPEFTFLSKDIKDMNRRVFGGEILETSMQELAQRYRSYQLQHAIRMIVEALRYGGAMADLLSQISKDMRNQQLVQKEIAGQLMLYTIFVAFAGLIAAPVLYGLTNEMITVTDTVWSGILQSNPAGLPATGLSFFKPSPPKITPTEYTYFSYVCIIVITSFASLIMAAISSGSAVKGLRYMPAFIIIGLLIYLVVGHVVGSLFSTIGTG
jgi:Flp pilus assembly protein TadB